MTSVAVSAVMIIIAIVLFFVLCMRGVNAILVALICSALVSLTVEGGLINGLFTIFAGGVTNMLGGLFLPFLTGGILGSLMMVSGSSERFGKTLINAFGIRFAPYSLMAFCMIIGYAGVTSWPFLGAILGLSLMRAANLPRNVACVVMVGTGGLCRFLLPGAVGGPNMIASAIYGTNLYAGASIGIPMFIVGLALNIVYIEYISKKYRREGIGYTAAPMETSMVSQAKSDEELPSFIVSVIPMVVAVGGTMFFQFVCKYNSYASCVYAQVIAAACIIVLNLKRIDDKFGAISNGILTACVPVLQTCIVVGFASVAGATAAYSALANAISTMNINPYLLIAVATAVLASVGADAVGGLNMAGTFLAQRCIDMGANPALLMRVSLAASTTFDTMPHSSNLCVTMNFLGLTHKEVYKQVLVVQVLITSIYTIVGTVIAMVIG